MFRSGILLKLIVFSVYFISSSSSSPLSPDKKQFFHGITSGKGLYSQFDKIALLNVSNFNETVFDEANPRAWVIEFYNSWCGHCHRFARVWKALALDVEGMFK
jgi:thiol oxidase